jgi:hypothetical protein
LAKTSGGGLPTIKIKLSSFPVSASSSLQGFGVEFADAGEAATWKAKEVEFWQGRDFSDGMPVGLTGAVATSTAYLKRLAAIDDNTAARWVEYFEEAKQLNLVIGQSRLGEALVRLHETDRENSFQMVLALSKFLHRSLSDQMTRPLATLRALLLISPAMLEAEGLLAVAERQKRIRTSAADLGRAKKKFEKDTEEHNYARAEERADTAEWIEARKLELDEYIADTKLHLTRLKDLYQKHIQTEAAANYWNKRANVSWAAGVLSLAVFMCLVATPLWLGWQNLDAIKVFLLEISNAPSGQISLTPIVAITVPVLAYAWILRHVSRLFIQSFTQADDARYRNVMTMTFLGLTKDPTSGVTDVERGIILNALFRPTPPNTSEDGPPAGLLDLIKKPL